MESVKIRAQKLSLSMETFGNQGRQLQAEDIVEYKTYMCVICGYVYDEEQGAPDDGLAPGTLWKDVPDTWKCPDCEATKTDFELIEI